MNKSNNQSSEKPVIEVKPHSYQPSKAEIEADVSIPTTPENLARCILQPVMVKETQNV